MSLKYRIGFFIPNGSGSDGLGYTTTPVAYASPFLTDSLTDFRLIDKGLHGLLTFKLSVEELFINTVVSQGKFICNLEWNRGEGWVEPINSRFKIEAIEFNDSRSVAAITMSKFHGVLNGCPAPLNEANSSLSITATYRAADTIYNPMVDSVPTAITVSDYFEELIAQAKTVYGLPDFVSADFSATTTNPWEASITSTLASCLKQMNTTNNFTAYWDGFTLKAKDTSITPESTPFAFTLEPIGFGTFTLSWRTIKHYTGFGKVSVFYNPSDISYDAEVVDFTPTSSYIYSQSKTLRSLGGGPVENDTAASSLGSTVEHSLQQPITYEHVRLINFELSDFLPFIDYSVGGYYRVETPHDGFLNERLQCIVVEDSDSGLRGLVNLGVESATPELTMLKEIANLTQERQSTL